jgi:hypothetical protein
VNEPKFGKPGKGCIQGIHFFIDKKAALKYLKLGFMGSGSKHQVYKEAIDISDVVDHDLTNIKFAEGSSQIARIDKPTYEEIVLDILAKKIFTSSNPSPPQQQPVVDIGDEING